MNWWRLYSVAFLLWMVAGLAGQQIQIRAWVDRNPVSVESPFTYIVEVKGKVRSLPEVQLPEFKDFFVLSGPNVSSSFQIINFEFSATQTYRVVLQARRQGKFTIPPASIQVNGRRIESDAVPVEVIQGPGKPARPQGPTRRPGNTRQNARQPDQQRLVMLKAIPSKAEVFLGEQVNLSYKVYFRVRIRDFDFENHPETVGFWVEEYPLSGEATITQEVVNGVQYNVAEIKRLALFPTKSGELTIPPVAITVRMVVPQRRQDPFGMLDEFFDTFGKMVIKRVESNPVTIRVKPLPEAGRPADFTGLVGDFRVISSVDKTELPANEALSYKVKILGRGLLKNLNRLPVSFPLSFEVFDPRVQEKLNLQGRYASSSKEMEYVLIPRTPGEFEIPPVKLSYFDPFERAYKTLRIPAYRVKVTRGKEIGAALAGNLMTKEEVALLNRDIFYIKEELHLQPIGYRVYRTVWFWAALFLPTLFLAGAYGYQNYRQRLASDVEYARRRRASRLARKHLREAQRLLKQEQLEAFYAEISRALIGFIADKTNRPAAGLRQEEIESVLQNYEVPPEIIQQCLACLNEADLKRFAGIQTSVREARQLFETVRRLMDQLERNMR